MTPTGTVTIFPVPGGSNGGIIAGPDGNLWFTGGVTIGKTTTSGTVTVYPLPVTACGPMNITAGGDGKLWFTEQNSGQVANLDPITLTAPPGPCLTITGNTTLTHDVGPAAAMASS